MNLVENEDILVSDLELPQQQQDDSSGFWDHAENHIEEDFRMPGPNHKNTVKKEAHELSHCNSQSKQSAK